MLCLSGFQLYSRWVPLTYQSSIAENRYLISSWYKPVFNPPYLFLLLITLGGFSWNFIKDKKPGASQTPNIFQRQSR